VIKDLSIRYIGNLEQEIASILFIDETIEDEIPLFSGVLAELSKIQRANDNIRIDKIASMFFILIFSP
jgi:hypothetical protein